MSDHSIMSTDSGWLPWRALRPQVPSILLWCAAVVTVALLRRYYWPWDIDWLQHPTGNNLITAVQVVPAIVIAIFVFAVGTLFVVAQVVPPARGTRAVEALRGQHVAWTISPALVLAPGSALVLVLPEEWGSPLASGLLLGVVVYLVLSTACLLAILREATDPAAFGRLMAREHKRAARVLLRRYAKSRDTPLVWEEAKWNIWTGRPGNAQSATDHTYSVARTVRGWARSAATAGDSRELLLALETTLTIVDQYPRRAANHNLLPTAYWEHAWHKATSPLYPTTGKNPNAIAKKRDIGTPVERCCKWFPNVLALEAPREKTAKAAAGLDGLKETRTLAAAAQSSDLVMTWAANEAGRSLVRAVEFASTSKTLLDRDRGRLLLTMEKAARLFHAREDYASAGVMVAYLIELGLGARRCPSDEISWHFDPLVTLARLHRLFDGGENDDDAPHLDLAVGTAAGVLKVAEAITSARVRDHFERKGEVSEASAGNGSLHKDVTDIAGRTCAELKRVPELSGFTILQHTQTKWHESPEWTIRLAVEVGFEPRDLPFVLATNARIIKELQEHLSGNTT